MSSTGNASQREPRPSEPWRWWRSGWVRFTLGAVLVLGMVSFSAIQYVLRHLEPILRKRIVETLSTRFDAPVELDQLHISLACGIEVEGHGLRIPFADVADEETPAYPLLAVRDFRFRTTLRSLFRQPLHATRVEVEGMELHLPPPSQRAVLLGARKARQPRDPEEPRTGPDSAIVVDVLSCKDVKLSIESGQPNKQPLIFIIRTLQLQDVGQGRAMPYEADLIHPKPHGTLHASGHFGPWAGTSHSGKGRSDPGKTPLDGEYRFERADLTTIHGIGGMLSSTGRFHGVLERIEVAGTADLPDFTLDLTERAMPLHTAFEAVIDGTSGDTYLPRVEARLLHSEFTASGKIVNIKGHGHSITLEVKIPAGHMQDFLRLAVKTDPPVLNGKLALQARLEIPPGHARVPLRMSMTGNFELEGIRFNNPQWQQRIDGLSARASGRPGEMQDAALDRETQTHSRMRSEFTISNGVMNFSGVEYSVPGACVLLNGVYSTDGKLFEFRGHVRTQATASQMVTGWKSWLLKPVDPLLRRTGAGVDLPVSITGTGGEVHLGLAMRGADDKPREILQDMRASEQRRRDLTVARKEAALADAADRRAAAATTLKEAEAEHNAAVQHRAEASRRAAASQEATQMQSPNSARKPR